MSDYGRISKSIVKAIADALRFCNGNEAQYTPGQMPNAVRLLKKRLTQKTITQNGVYIPPSNYDGFDRVMVNVEGSGGDAVLVSKNIIANGNYSPVDDNADGYSSVSVAVPGPNLQSKTATANGTVTPDSGYDGLSSVEVAVPNTYSAADNGKVVSNGQLVAQTARAAAITQNGTYDTTVNNSVTINVSGGGSGGAVVQPLSVTQNGTYNPPSGVDGYAPVTVNVSGGGSDLYPLWTDIYDNPMPTGVSVTTPSITAPVIHPSWVASASQNVQDFSDNECRISGSSASASSVTANITKEMAQMSLSQVIADDSLFGGLVEYYGNLYNNTLLTTYGMVLLGDFSQGGSTAGNTLADAITNYSAVALQGIYNKNRTSGYNTTIVYPLDLNVARWTGMKDRNHTYDCSVTFTDANTVSLSGNKQVIIYGIP